MSLQIERGAEGVVTLTMAHGAPNAIATPLRRALVNALMDAQ